MRVTLERSSLLKSLSHIQRVVERRNTIPILSNVLLKAQGNALMLKATDLDIEVTETTPASVETDGSTTVPAHMLYDIIRKLPDGSEVMLSVGEGNGLSLKSGRSSFQLQMLPESDFPDLTAAEFSHTFTMDCAAFKSLIDRTQFAISTEETRYYLNGIYLHTVDVDGGSMLRAVATDGHRLAQAQVPAPDGAAGMPGIIVPRKAVGEVQKLLESGDDTVSVELSDTKIRFTVGPVVLTSKLIDGTFPDYNRVIPVRQRQETGARSRLFRFRRGSGFHHRVRPGPCGEAVDLRRPTHPVRQQPRFGVCGRGATGRLRIRRSRYRFQLPLPARHHQPADVRRDHVHVGRPRFAYADHGKRAGRCALRADADAGVTGVHHRLGAPIAPV